MRESGGKFNGEDRRGDTGTPEPSSYILLHVCGFGRACPVPCAFATLALAAPACLVLAHPKIIVEGSDLHMKRHRFQDTSMTSEKVCQERRVCQVSGFRAVDKIGLQDSEMSGASRINRKWQHQTKMPRARNVADKRSRCRRPCQPGGQGPFL